MTKASMSFVPDYELDDSGGFSRQLLFARFQVLLEAVAAYIKH